MTLRFITVVHENVGVSPQSPREGVRGLSEEANAAGRLWKPTLDVVSVQSSFVFSPSACLWTASRDKQTGCESLRLFQDV